MVSRMSQVFRKKEGEPKPGEGKLIESTNALPADAFFSKYGPDDLVTRMSSALRTPDFPVAVDCTEASALKAAQLDMCLNLIQNTSEADYAKSEMGWSWSKKRREMKLPDLKYILLLDKADGDTKLPSSVLGFISFMITYEDGHEVIYVYEIHFVPEWQGKGIGRVLMHAVEGIGANVGVEKAMLTVFKSNKRAVKWYEGLGYNADEYSPEPRRLRNGTVKEPTYFVLSKKLPQQMP